MACILQRETSMNAVTTASKYLQQWKVAIITVVLSLLLKTLNLKENFTVLFSGPQSLV